ncbi:MAG: hypothetical protein COB53_09790 [Elusimicrobia bacterium]|nr:MAG: hypothetical protein COB53_09790 [Elusimicrobiota bacterium]
MHRKILTTRSKNAITLCGLAASNPKYPKFPTLPVLECNGFESIGAWSFGDTPELADKLGALVLAGKKTATSGLKILYEKDQEPIPQPGDLSIILNSRKEQICVIETTEVIILPFSEIGEDIAREEGEGDLSLEYWRRVHKEYFSKYCDFKDTMEVIAERFRLVEKLA